MERRKLSEMTKGWFIGNFEPTVYSTHEVEVGVKEYKKGDFEEVHHHRIATEITTIISGRVKMNGNVYEAGDIVIIKPFEATNFKALQDTTTSVVKIPGAKEDKYIGTYEH